MDYARVDTILGLMATSVASPQISAVIARYSAEITQRLGAEPGSPITQVIRGPRGTHVKLAFPPAHVVAVYEGSPPVAVEASGYVVEDRFLERTGVNVGSPFVVYGEEIPRWAMPVCVTYYMDEGERQRLLARCEQACIDLVRLELADTGYLQEAIGRRTVTARDKLAEKERILAALMPLTGGWALL